jgi:hypothetical protein
MPTFYTNLLPIIDECNDYIPIKEGRYFIVTIRVNMIHIMNVNNGAQAVIRKDYFEKDFEPCE